MQADGGVAADDGSKGFGRLEVVGDLDSPSGAVGPPAGPRLDLAGDSGDRVAVGTEQVGDGGPRSFEVLIGEAERRVEWPCGWCDELVLAEHGDHPVVRVADRIEPAPAGVRIHDAPGAVDRGEHP